MDSYIQKGCSAICIVFFSQLINLKQKGSMVEHIMDFQKLNIRVTDILEEHMIDVFIGT